MQWLSRILLGVLAFGTMASSLLVGQTPFPGEAAPFNNSRPRSAQELNQLEALSLFGFGRLLERKYQVVEAVQTYEEAAKLDPKSPSLHKALIPLYFAIDRPDDAVAECRQTLKLSPNDYETWYFLGRHLKGVGQLAEAQTSLERAVACPALKKQPDLFAQIALDLVKLYDDKKTYIQALAVLEEILQTWGEENTDPKAAEIYETIGQIAMKAGQPERTVQAIQKAQAIYEPRESIKARRLDYPLAQAYAAKGNPKEALAKLDQYLLTQPPGTEPYEMKMRVLKQLGRGKETVPFLHDAISRDSNNTTLKLLLANQLVLDNKYKEAERLYLDLAGETPFPDVYQGLFRLYKVQKRMDDALTLLDKAIADGTEDDQKPGDAGQRNRARAMIVALRSNPEMAGELIPAARNRLQANQKLEPDTRRFLTVVAHRTRQLDVAENLYSSLLETAQNSKVESAVYGGLLQVLWQAGKYEKVIEVCRNGLQKARNTNRLLFHSNLSRALVILGKTDEALAEADQAVQLSDDENRCHFGLLRAEIYRMSEKYERAEAVCFTLLKETAKLEDTREIRYTLSNIYSAANQVEKAQEQLRLVLQMDPDNATAHNDLGYIMADHNQNLEEAEKLIRRALDLDAEKRPANKIVSADDDQPNAAYIDSLGWVLFRRGRFEEARRELEKAAALPEGEADPVVWDHLGDVYFRLGETAKTRSAWQKAVKLYEMEKRRKLDKQYKELKHKLQILEANLPPR